MKKIILAIILCCSAVNIALANVGQVVIFNTSTKYDIVATYEICNFDSISNTEICSTDKTVLIKAKKSQADKNYVVMTDDQNPKNTNSNMLEIISAVEKDENGNIVAQSKFFDKAKKITSNCLGSLTPYESTYDHIGNAQLILSDQLESPYLTCLTSYFVTQ